MISVGIGEYAVTDNKDETLVTYALGSCVALIIYHPQTKLTAMAHIVLPKGKSSFRPGYFAEKTVPELLDFFINEKGIKKEQLIIHMIGGAESKNKKDIFKVGEKNISKISSILKKNGLKAINNDTGGNISRTVSIDVKDGNIKIKQQNMIL